VPRLSSNWSRSDRVGTVRVRCGIGRDDYRTQPGLYRIGDPTPESPVLVTANYKLTVDVVRRDLAGHDAWLLVVDTKGVNVWCAAGKRTFSSAEVARRVITSGLVDYVSHETLVLPQLAATGVAAHEVRKLCGYRVVFGPVRSADLPAYLSAGMKATSEMREVTFTFKERIELAPVEFLAAFSGRRLLIPLALVALSGFGPGIWSLANVAARAPFAVGIYFTGILAGAIGVPALLPYLPGRALGWKGAELGAFAAWVVCGFMFRTATLTTIAAILGAGAVAAYLGVNFTGSTPYTSPSGVEKELRRGLPWMALAATASVVLWVATAWIG
jgi:CO dehydrogenase/acetyl-CoA synthase delta subunit